MHLVSSFLNQSTLKICCTSFPRPIPQVVLTYDIIKTLFAMEGDKLENPSDFISVVGALQYLTYTRPDLSFIVNKLRQLLQNLTIVHYKAGREYFATCKVQLILVIKILPIHPCKSLIFLTLIRVLHLKTKNLLEGTMFLVDSLISCFLQITSCFSI